MKPPKIVFACQECGAQAAKWVGRCPDCGAWNSMVEERAAPQAAAPAAGIAKRYSLAVTTGPQLYADIDTVVAERLSSGIDEFDRVLGGGVVPGSLVLIGGEPGIGKHVTLGATVHTDAFTAYRGLEADFVHNVIDHAEKYVEGNVHTNGCENFWSLLKRALKGTYVAVEPFHLFRYLDEQSFRFNERSGNDASRFLLALVGIVHKRLTYRRSPARSCRKRAEMALPQLKRGQRKRK